ncbi:hypothetical protein D3C86_2020030 [compost metagenome]
MLMRISGMGGGSLGRVSGGEVSCRPPPPGAEKKGDKAVSASSIATSLASPFSTAFVLARAAAASIWRPRISKPRRMATATTSPTA